MKIDVEYQKRKCAEHIIRVLDNAVYQGHRNLMLEKIERKEREQNNATLAAKTAKP